MMMRAEKNINAEKLARAEAMLAEMTAQVLRRGFFGSATIELSIQDGTIQRLCRRIERCEK